MTNQHRILLIIILVCLTATVGFLSLAKRSEDKTQPITTVQDYGTGSRPLIIVSNPKEFQQKVGGARQATTLLNQIYAENYKLTGKLDKEAQLDGDITQKGSQTDFVLKLSPSNTKLSVTVKMKNASSNNYELGVRKVGN